MSTLGDTSKKRRRWVGTCGEDVILLFGAENWSNQKRERETGRQPWWLPFGGTMQQSKNCRRKRWGSNGGEIRPGRNVWDDAMSSFRPSNWSTNNKRKKYNAALNGCQTMLIRTTNNQKQPGGTGEGYERTHDRQGGQGGCNVIVLDAIELSWCKN